jgi:hypothetical protein
MTRILILGHARHGKDTVAERLRDEWGVSFRSSSLFLAETVVRPALAERGIDYPDLDACYADRVNHRALWREVIAQYNGEDAARLAKAILAVCDCYVGMRTEREYRAAHPLFDYILWVDASGRGLPPEGRDSMTIDFDPGTMHLIDNGGTLAELHERVDAMAAVMGLSRTRAQIRRIADALERGD